jgi:hypothetical protein
MPSKVGEDKRKLEAFGSSSDVSLEQADSLRSQ